MGLSPNQKSNLDSISSHKSLSSPQSCWNNQDSDRIGILDFRQTQTRALRFKTYFEKWWFGHHAQTKNSICIPSAPTGHSHLSNYVLTIDTPIAPTFEFLDPPNPSSLVLKLVWKITIWAPSSNRESNLDFVFSYSSLSALWSCWNNPHTDQGNILDFKSHESKFFDFNLT